MDRKELIPHLFRTEFSKISSVLIKHFGIDHIEEAEDITSQTFLSALETWPYKGLPPNPTAWLYAVAKNKAKNYISRNSLYNEKVKNMETSFMSYQMEIDLSSENIADSQLQMMFTLCHRSIPIEAQVAMSLRILCGFGIEEIADAFLTTKDTINKRLLRAREKLRNEKIKIEFPADGKINEQLKTVLTTLYLLFNEGYYSESRDEIVREELCLEAMRLTSLLIENERTNLPEVKALFSLMCLQASRLKARKNNIGEMVLYDDQDESLWDRELISKGVACLHQASAGSKLSKYHIEASIAYWHTTRSYSDKWENILQLYNQLLLIEYSPIAALNRTYALSRVYGNLIAIQEAEKLDLTNNHFYFTLLGELYKGVDNKKALMNLERGLSLAKTTVDKNTIQKKINALI